MYKRGITLIELLIALALCGVIFLAVFHVSVLAGKQIGVYVERYNAYSQVGYALEDMALHMTSASKIENPFQAAQTNNTSLSFVGTSDVYNITPYEGDTRYRYWVDTASGDLVREQETLANSDKELEVLIESKFHPYVEFVRDQNMEPNFLMVVVSVNCTKSASIGLRPEVVKAEGIKFWFVDIVSP